MADLAATYRKFKDAEITGFTARNEGKLLVVV
jgi:hypothetical protein